MTDRKLETFITLVLEEFSAELSQAHRELYPERIPEQIPLSLTLLYPWIPAEEVAEQDLERVRAFFAQQKPLRFDLTHIAEFPGLVVYAVPEPDDELRAMMRRLWSMYPQHPPYGEPGSDPPPHCTVGRLDGEYAVTVDQVERRLHGLLPVRCEVGEATLIEEYAPDRCRVRERFPFTGMRDEQAT